MIEEGRMSGEIDQVDEIIRFDQLTPEQIWNNQIKYTCDQINATGGLKKFSRQKRLRPKSCIQKHSKNRAIRDKLRQIQDFFNHSVQ